ncbi:MAG: hypothetical protein JRJ37_12450, partial [Deltaproteobacteria bacterium]|nr:hypothetical protein [Deltaproteobacteria bacterium]
MAKSFGWSGKILQIDLTTQKITKLPTADFEPEKYIGGVGLSTKIFWEMGCPKVDAFDPENPLIIATGPLTGVPGPFNRAEICGKAPQSYPELMFSYSGIGGKFPSELKYAGYDAVVVTGMSAHPVYVSICDEHVSIKDASDLWGLDLIESQRVLMARIPKSSVLAIGPAGENLSRIAVIGNETGSTAGQGGFGALMGSKNLKAVAVTGTGNVALAKPEQLMDLLGAIRQKGDWHKGGFQRFGRVPVFAEDPGKEAITQELVGKYRKKFAGSYGCPLQCYSVYDVPGIGKAKGMCGSWWYGIFVDNAKAAWEALVVSQKLGINHFDLAGLMFIIIDSL